MRENRHPGRAHLCNVLPGEDPQNALHVQGLGGIYAVDLGMRKRGADEGDVDQTGQHDVVHINAAALHEPLGVRTGNRLADVGIGPVRISELNGHAAPLSARARATVSTASTIASYPVQRQ